MTILLEFIGLGVFGYFMGSIPFGVIIAKQRGVDIFKVGSGNIGATNVWRALGAKWGLLVFLLDLVKGAIPSGLAHFLVPDHRYQAAWAAVGLCAMVGHSLSPWIGFKGGKGISTLMGAILGASPFVSLSGFAVFVVVLTLGRIVSISSIVAVTSALGWAWVFHDAPGMYVIYGAAWVLMIVRHKANLRRLFHGEEPRFTIKKSIK